MGEEQRKAYVWLLIIVVVSADQGFFLLLLTCRTSITEVI